MPSVVPHCRGCDDADMVHNVGLIAPGAVAFTEAEVVDQDRYPDVIGNCRADYYHLAISRKPVE